MLISNLRVMMSRYSWVSLLMCRFDLRFVPGGERSAVKSDEAAPPSLIVEHQKILTPSAR